MESSGLDAAEAVSLILNYITATRCCIVPLRSDRASGC